MKKRFVVLAAGSLLVVMCGGREAATGGGGEGAASGVSTVETAAAEQAPASEGPADFSAADLDLYERGIVEEIAVVKGAREKAANAATPAERGKAAQEEWEDQSIPAAAKAAGIDVERYRHTRNAVHHVFETLDFQGKIAGPMEMDMERASEEAKARLAKDAFATLTPAAAAALRARMDRLVPAWIEYATLTAVNG
ncbi:MAG TPA: hypothetical protein VGF69_16950 [Thermoanaerobaculia bacterium]|jgi:hypothetical protein